MKIKDQNQQKTREQVLKMVEEFNKIAVPTFLGVVFITKKEARFLLNTFEGNFIFVSVDDGHSNGESVLTLEYSDADVE